MLWDWASVTGVLVVDLAISLDGLNKADHVNVVEKLLERLRRDMRLSFLAAKTLTLAAKLYTN